MVEAIKKDKIRKNIKKMPLKLFKGIFVYVVLFPFVLTAQTSEPFIDSIINSFNYPPRLDLRLDARTSFITNNPARIVGVKLGVDFNDKVKVGIGYNWLRSTILNNEYINKGLGRTEIYTRLVLRYFSPYFEYTYHNSPKLELSIPVMIGLGTSHYTPLNVQDSPFYTSNPRMVVFYEPSSTGLYKPIKWFGIGFGIGYRLVFVGNRGLNQNFNSPIYVLRAKLLLGEIYRSIGPLIKEE